MKQLSILIGLPLCLLLVLTGCGYQLGQGGLPESYSTFSMNYVEGDREGFLTSEIVQEVGSQGSLSYVNCNGDLILHVKLEDVFDDPIGYRFDREKNGQLSNRLITTEGRLTSIAIVTIIDRCSGCIVAGPARIIAKIDFDHDYNTINDKIPSISLGQLDDIEVARDIALNAIDRELATKIARYIYTLW